MHITDIRTTKKGRISIYVDDEYYCVIHAEIFAVSKLKSGEDFPQDYLDELICKSQDKISREKALTLISQREYTASILFDKLILHVDEQYAQSAVERMIELGLVNDADYAKRLAKDCLRRRGFSITRTSRVLNEKGLDRALIEETLATLLEELDYDPQPAIAKIVLRKYLRYIYDEKGYQKTMNALNRLGYRFSDIRAVLENIQEDESYYKNELDELV